MGLFDGVLFDLYGLYVYLWGELKGRKANQNRKVRPISTHLAVVLHVCLRKTE